MTPTHENLSQNAAEEIGLDCLGADSIYRRNDATAVILRAITSATAELTKENEELKKWKDALTHEEPELAKQGPEEIWGWFVHWNEIIAACNQAWKNPKGYSQSPIELITEIINERDDLHQKLSAASEKLLRIQGCYMALAHGEPLEDLFTAIKESGDTSPASHDFVRVDHPVLRAMWMQLEVVYGPGNKLCKDYQALLEPTLPTLEQVQGVYKNAPPTQEKPTTERR